MFTSTGEPSKLLEAFGDDRWRKAMKEEYTAVMNNKTWHLVSPSSTKNLIDCKWVYHIKKMQMAQLTDTRHSWLQKDLSKGMA
jgi:hypothetical protein